MTGGEVSFHERNGKLRSEEQFFDARVLCTGFPAYLWWYRYEIGPFLEHMRVSSGQQAIADTLRSAFVSCHTHCPS